MSDCVPEDRIDYDAVFARGGRNHGDEEFAIFKCPNCDQVYLLECKIDTVYLDGKDLTQRKVDFEDSFDCVKCQIQDPMTLRGSVQKHPTSFVLRGDN